MRISLIITTYNWKEALQLSLKSCLEQTRLPNEIVVADDGSRDDTKMLVETIAAQSPVPLYHSWQADKGFRLAKSRNKAIAKASGEYIILIDGDIILDPHFVSDHCEFASQGYFVQGTRVLLNKTYSAKVLTGAHLAVPLFARGVENKKNCLRSRMLARLFSFRSKRLPGIKTCNFAFWREDALKINGFNEQFVGWGREDSEFTARLLNAGIKRQNVKFYALGYHLYHPINTRERLSINDGILRQTIEQKLTWCEQGINQYLESGRVIW